MIQDPAADEAQATGLRRLQGVPHLWCKVLVILIPVCGIPFVLKVHTHLGILLFREQYGGLFLGLLLGAVFLLYPGSKTGPWDRAPWYDVALSVLGVSVGTYLAVMYPEIAFTTLPSWTSIVFAGLAILLVIEATRRVLGWSLVILCIAGILYLRYGYLMSGMLQINKLEWTYLISYLYVDANAMLGVAIWVVSTIVLGFFLLGEVITVMGGREFITDFAFRLFGRFRGGPAKVAIVASSLFGSISGSAVANVVFTGTMTIPMMKKAGYPPHVAGAIEATASTGGQIMPPMMGITAFILASFLNISYGTVVLAAIVPALLFYLSLFIQVDAEAVARNIRTIAPREHVPFLTLMKRSHTLLFPLAGLVYTLFVLNYEPGTAAVTTAGFCLLVEVVLTKGRVILRLLSMLENVGRSLLMLGAISAIAGFVLGTLSLSGLGFNLGQQLVIVGEQSMLLFTLLLAVGCLILGMGMPTPIVYVFLASLIGASIKTLGLLPLGAHLFVLFLGTASMITPPVCYSSFAAASIAQARFYQTGFQAARFSMAAYLLPFMFLFNHGILLQATVPVIIVHIVVTVAVVFLAASGVAGYFMNNKLSPIERSGAILLPIIFALTQGLQNPYVFWLGSSFIGVLLLYLSVRVSSPLAAHGGGDHPSPS